MDVLKLSKGVYSQILDTIGKYPPECGGVLGAGEDGIITEFFFDETGKSTPSGYAPDVTVINDMLINDWMPRGILMVGIVHSHANGINVPSCGDISYGIRILQALDTVDKFYLPIVTTDHVKTEISCYGIYPDPERQYVCRRIACEIYDEESISV